MNTNENLKKIEKKPVYDFEPVFSLISSLDPPPGTDPTSPFTLTSTHVLSDL